MVKTTSLSVSPEFGELFYRNLQPGDRFVIPNIRLKIPELSLSRKKGLTSRSLLPQVSELWKNFDSLQKQDWNNAGAVCGMRGYNLFVQDQCLRIKNEYEGVATPSLLHQSYVGVLWIDEPATELIITQIHPHYYYVLKKVKGTKSQYSPVQVAENFALPLKISLCYSSGLSVVNPNNYARFYARVWSSYQGRDIFTDIAINLDYSTDWKKAEAILSNVQGYVIGYTLFIEIKGLQGFVYFDNIEAIHSGQNWVRDFRCQNINQGFTRAYYQIPKSWAAVSCPSGAWFESFYINF